MTSKEYRLLRNIVIVIGIVGGFVLWLFIPPVIENNWLFHVGNGQYGSKGWALLLLLIPLFALNEQKIEVHAEDAELINMARNKTARKGLFLAILCSGSVLVAMGSALLWYF